MPLKKKVRQKISSSAQIEGHLIERSKIKQHSKTNKSRNPFHFPLKVTKILHDKNIKRRKSEYKNLAMKLDSLV